MSLSPTQSPKLNNNILPTSIDNSEREARASAEYNQAKTDGAAARDELADGLSLGANAIGNSSRAAGNRVTNWFTTGGHKTRVAAQNAGESIQANANEIRSSAKSSYAKFTSDISAAGNAGATGSSYTRSTPANPTFAERIGGAIRAPFSGVSYIANHAASNPVHSTRESNWHARLSNVATVAGAAAALWATSFITAGAAPRLAGWIIKPAPYTAGIVSIPNLSAYAFYGSAAVLGAAIIVRVGVAVYDKLAKEGHSAPAAAPSAENNTVN